VKLSRYLEVTFSEVVREARGTGVVIYFVDEAALHADAHRGTTWAPGAKTKRRWPKPTPLAAQQNRIA